jgi:uncharacterized membrane protein YgaE (UPF0421/DUF939 family)
MDRATLVPALQLSSRAAAAAGLSLALAQLFQLQYPLYAMIAAVIVTDLSPAETRKLGWRRLAGTVLGTLIGIVLGLLLPHSVWTMALGIFLTMFLMHLLGLPEAARIAGYLCALVLLEHGADAPLYALWRFVETVLGIAVAFVVSLVPKLLGKPT